MRMQLSLMVSLAVSLSLPSALTAALPDEEAADEVRSRLSRIESAFRDGDADALRHSLSATGKIRVDLRDLTDGQASYGAGQLQVMFGHIFEDFRTREFTFRKNEVRISAPGTAFARGRWVRRGVGGGHESADNLTFTLRQEGRDWRIVEIRSSR